MSTEVTLDSKEKYILLCKKCGYNVGSKLQSS